MDGVKPQPSATVYSPQQMPHLNKSGLLARYCGYRDLWLPRSAKPQSHGTPTTTQLQIHLQGDSNNNPQQLSSIFFTIRKEPQLDPWLNANRRNLAAVKYREMANFVLIVINHPLNVLQENRVFNKFNRFRRSSVPVFHRPTRRCVILIN